MRLQPLVLVALCTGFAAPCGAGEWLNFRGPGQRSVAAADAHLPTTWSLPSPEEPGSGENIAWQADLPGRGLSGPIVVAGKVIVTAASGPTEDRLHVLCFDARTGALDWERQFWATGRTFFHPTSGVAANTPASDGRLIYASFSSNDLVCLDLAGNLQWFRGLAHDYPTAANDVGMASSPLVVGELVIVQVESLGTSFTAGIDKHTGQTRWQIDRTQGMNWTSPSLLAGDTQTGEVLLLQSPGGISGHDPATGKQLWQYTHECGGIPSPVGLAGVVYVPSQGMTALRPVADSEEPEVAWNSNQLALGNASPVVGDGRVYALNRAGALSCGDTATGETLWRSRVKGTFWSTPVLVGKLLYTFNDAGTCQVIDVESGDKVAENQLGERVMASPAVVDDALYVRGDHHLWRISQP